MYTVMIPWFLTDKSGQTVQTQTRLLIQSLLFAILFAIQSAFFGSIISWQNHLSLVVRKPAFCICENKGADQLRYMDSTIPLLPES